MHAQLTGVERELAGGGGYTLDFKGQVSFKKSQTSLRAKFVFIIKSSFAAQQLLTNKNPVNVKPKQGHDGDKGKRWSRNLEKHCVTTYEGD